MTSLRLVGAALAVVLLVPDPGSAAPAAPAPTRAAAGIALVDTDGDGLDDLVDGCPTVASGNATGCPSAWRKAALEWRGGVRRLQVRVSSPEPSCVAGARVSLWRVRRPGDVKVDGANVSSRGRHRFRAARGATYYVTVSPSYSPGRAECGRATSRRVRVPR